MEKTRRTDGILFRFAIIFTIFIVVTVAVSGVSTYINQNRIYQAQCEENIQNIAAYLEDLMALEGEEFVWYQDYLLSHYEEIDIPIDFDDYIPEKLAFEEMLAKEYPGKTLGVDLTFDELSEECKKAFTIYKHEYWLLTYEKARPDFGVIYTYYTVPSEKPRYVYYMIDAVRDPREDNDNVIDLCIEVPQVIEEHGTLWEAWDTGVAPEGYDYYDNEYGRTYAYYAPAYVSGEKTGIIGVEIEIAAVDQAILANTIRQVVTLAVILVVAVLILLWFINHFYIRKLEHLSASVRQYAQDKKIAIASDIERDGNGRDEISSLANQTAAMILELDNYMKNLVATTKELSETKLHADEMHELANKDALTGIRNKTAYDNEIKKLEWKLDDGYTDFGIAMIDLNFLKRINDTYGHEQGNIAIRKLCQIVCTIYQHSPVFRIGGDEFVVILENQDFENREELLQKFNQQLEEMAKDETLEVWERVSAAIGYAVYDPATDSSVANVFKRADNAMYQRKKEMKAVRG